MKPKTTIHFASEAVNLLRERNFKISEGVEDFIVEQNQRVPHSLSLQLLAGIGVFFASLFAFVLLGSVGIISFAFQPSFFLWSVLFIAAAISIKKNNSYEDSFQYCFRAQISFVMMALGKVFFVIGSCAIAEGVLDSGWVMSLALALISGVTYKKYPVDADRFVSSLAFLTSVTLNIIDPMSSSKFAELFLLGWFLAQIFLAIYLSLSQQIGSAIVPVRHALFLSLIVIVFILTSGRGISEWAIVNAHYTYLVNLLLVVGMCWCMATLSGGFSALLKSPLLMAGLGIVFLAGVSAPGILLSILLLMLGYAKHDRVLIGLGLCVLPVFLFLYYYNLKVSLLYKSGVLLASGIIALLGCVYLRYHKCNQGGS